MDRSSPATPDPSSNANGATNRRRSGRTVHKPVVLQEDPNVSQITNGNGKRKRTDIRGGDMTEVQDDNSEGETSPEDTGGDADEEEVKEKTRRAAKLKKAQSKRTAKKPKTTVGTTTKLAVRPATNGFKKPAKPKKPRARANLTVIDDGTGLYCRFLYRQMAYAILTMIKRRSSRKGIPSMQWRQTGLRATSSITPTPCVI